MNPILCLEQFSTIIQYQDSFCCINDKAHLSLDNINLKNNASLDNYPKEISDNALIYNQNQEETRMLFQESDNVLFRRLLRIYFDQGLIECINIAADLYQTNTESRVVTLPAYYLKKTLDWIQNIRYMLQPHFRELFSSYMLFYETRNWVNSSIRYLSWHPLCPRLAVATLYDTVNIFHCGQNIPATILRGRKQKNISCLFWRPYAAFELAVGSSIGVILWKIDSNSIQIQPSMANAVILKQSNVTSIAWNTWGTLLITASAFYGSILVWNCEQNKNEKVWCSSAGVNLVTWAMTTHYIFTSGVQGTYRVWDSCSWSYTQWHLNRGVIQTACWTPCGSHLIFASSEDPNVFTINMNVALSPNKSSTPLMGPTCLFETTKISLPSGEDCGGLVQNLQLSSNGLYLAVMFKVTNYIAVCKLTFSCAVLQIFPCFIFSGLAGEQPANIDFQKCNKESSLLTTAWSNGRIQHIPIISM